MNRFDTFAIDLLKRAKAGQDRLQVCTSELASKYEIEEKYIREKLESLHTEKYIRLWAQDAYGKDKPLDEWVNRTRFLGH
jgi:hypothetical protein